MTDYTTDFPFYAVIAIGVVLIVVIGILDNGEDK